MLLQHTDLCYHRSI